uniref:Putative secreted protein n=1 Tax=Anopheles marajoara TaxID=58244 RepID=A0A2M4CC91_9DIPT
MACLLLLLVFCSLPPNHSCLEFSSWLHHPLSAGAALAPLLVLRAVQFLLLLLQTRSLLHCHSIVCNHSPSYATLLFT